MSRIAVMMASGRADGPMSSHFGKAEWIMIAGTEAGSLEFERNGGLNGRSAADLLIRHGCTDAILVDIGEGALGHLQAAKINVWAAPGPVTGDEALRMLAEGRLPAVPEARGTTRRSGGCCGHHDASAASTRCCG